MKKKLIATNPKPKTAVERARAYNAMMKRKRDEFNKKHPELKNEIWWC